MKFTDPIGVVKGVGSARKEVLEKAGIQQVGDLLSYLPYNYEDSTNIVDIESAREIVLKTPVWEMNSLRLTVKATLEKATTIRTRRGLVLITANFLDESSEKKIKAIWFNQPYKLHELSQGKVYILYGRVQKEGQNFTFQSPKTEEVIEGIALAKLGGVLPVYRRIKSATSTYLRKYINDALEECTVEEYIPEEILKVAQIPLLKESMQMVHKPKDIKSISLGYQRLATQELLELRQEYDEKFVKQGLDHSGREYAEKLAQLFGAWIPKLTFRLTAGQERILQQSLELIRQGMYLDALVYGDVGSGKTILSLLLSFGFAKLGFSSLLIAPTTILASQHLKTATRLAAQLGIQNEVFVEAIKAGKVKLKEVTVSTVYIGTQAILHNEKLLAHKIIKFVSIDEQHRFGVEQRTLLKRDGRHVLTLSATPIPRTLALSFLGFSEAFILEERPAGRKEVISRLVPREKETATYEWIVQHLVKGEQVFVVFPRIESEEETEKQSLLAMAELLKNEYFSAYTSSVLYGALKDEEKNRIMADFSSGKIRILFSTSVIEVGVDVANATIIAIHGAELFGLAQLHQLRGRVGRSSQQGYCLLFSGIDNPESMKRLEYFAEHHQGIEVSEYDLKNRGTGTLLGKQQSGLSELKIAQVTDLTMIRDTMKIYEQLKERKVAIVRYFRVKSGNE